MSLARECDLCGDLFVWSKGNASIDVSIAATKNGVSRTWSAIDFCAGCSKKLLDLIAPSMNGLEHPRKIPNRAKGGHATAKMLSPAQRTARARAAATARWNKDRR